MYLLLIHFRYFIVSKYYEVLRSNFLTAKIITIQSNSDYYDYSMFLRSKNLTLELEQDSLYRAGRAGKAKNRSSARKVPFPSWEKEQKKAPRRVP